MELAATVFYVVLFAPLIALGGLLGLVTRIRTFAPGHGLAAWIPGALAMGIAGMLAAVGLACPVVRAGPFTGVDVRAGVRARRRGWAAFVVATGVYRYRVAITATIGNAAAAIHGDGRLGDIGAASVAITVIPRRVYGATAQACQGQRRKNRFEQFHGGFRVRQESMAHE